MIEVTKAAPAAVRTAPKAGRLVATLTTGPDRDGGHAFVTRRAAAFDFDAFGFAI
jgi:hypothetical protein